MNKQILFLLPLIFLSAFPAPARAENLLPTWLEVKTEFDQDYAPDMDKYFAFLGGSALFGLAIKGLISV
jgi:hypothetical protein